MYMPYFVDIFTSDRHSGYLYLVATKTVILYTYFGYTLVQKYLFKTKLALILLKINLRGVAGPYRSLFNLYGITTIFQYGCSDKGHVGDYLGLLFLDLVSIVLVLVILGNFFQCPSQSLVLQRYLFASPVLELDCSCFKDTFFQYFSF